MQSPVSGKNILLSGQGFKGKLLGIPDGLPFCLQAVLARPFSAWSKLSISKRQSLLNKAQNLVRE